MTENRAALRIWRITAFVALLVPSINASVGSAQPAQKMYRIGTLASSPIHPAFRRTLATLGYVEGKNLSFVHRQARRIQQYPALAKERVALDVDLILTVGISPTRAAKNATRTIPIVMGNSSADPVRNGLIDSLAEPGGNVTGVFDLLPDLAGKRLEVLKEIFPNLSRVAHLTPGATPVGPAHLEAMTAAARAMGVRVQALNAAGPGDLDNAFRSAAAGGAEALVVVGVSFFIPHKKRIVNLSIANRMPIMVTHQLWAPLGALVSYATDAAARHGRAAQYVDRIFRGATPADLPVEQPRKFVLEVNLKTARTLGVTIPPSVLLRAEKVIE